MKFFIDTADLDEIREALSWGWLPVIKLKEIILRIFQYLKSMLAES